MNCILLEMDDRRNFLTAEENLPHLRNFAEIMNARLSSVNSREKPLDLQELAQAICNPTAGKNPIEYKLLKIECDRTARRGELGKCVMAEILARKSFSIKELSEKFRLTPSAIGSHVRNAKKCLEEQGYCVKKIKPGKYQLI